MWTTSIICLLNFTGVSLLATVGCVPVQAVWDVRIKDKKCVSMLVFVHYCYYVGGEFPRIPALLSTYICRYLPSTIF